MLKSAIAILTYRRHDSLKLMLEQVLKECADPLTGKLEVPVAVFEDCGQSDATEDYLLQNATFLRRDFVYEADVYDRQGVTVYLSHNNAGVTGNSNKAMKWFMDETDCDHLCLCNDDLEVLGPFYKTYAEAHEKLGVGLFCFCDFEDESYKWVTVKSKGIPVKLLTRMTGIMMSMTRALIDDIGYYDADAFVFGQEHSLVAGTPILMSDYTWKRIEDVKIGDCVMGWEKPERHGAHQTFVKTSVTKVHSYDAETVEMTTRSGKAIFCTADHWWYNGVVRGKAHFAQPKKGLKLRRITGLASLPTPMSSDYMRGYVAGAMDGAGTYGRTPSTSHYLRVTDSSFVRRFTSFLSDLGLAHRVKETTYEAKSTGGLLVGTRPITFIQFWGEVTSPTAVESDDFWAGWLGGMYDAEGCSTSIAQDKSVNPDVYSNVVRALQRFSFRTVEKPHQVEWLGGRPELIRFWNLARPAIQKKIDAQFSVYQRNCVRAETDPVESVKKVGAQRVYCLTTDSGNYFADGYMSHNCDYTARARFRQFINLNGNPQHCLDIVCPHLKHQNVKSSLTDSEKQIYNAHADMMINVVANTYMSSSLYRPFSTGRWEMTAGGRDKIGIPLSSLKGYSRVRTAPIDPDCAPLVALPEKEPIEFVDDVSSPSDRIG